MTGRPRDRFDPTTVAGSPSTVSVAPTAKRSSSSLACSTKNDPSSPCGLPTRPIRTSSATEDRERLGPRRRAQHVLGRKRLGLRVAGAPHELGGALEVVVGLPQRDRVVFEQRPEGSGAPLVGAADAAGVHEQHVTGPALELHVRVPGYNAV